MICRLTGERILYLECQDCEDRLTCKTSQSVTQMQTEDQKKPEKEE